MIVFICTFVEEKYKQIYVMLGTKHYNTTLVVQQKVLLTFNVL